MKIEDAEAFVREWIESWNAHDLERILAHWADDCTFRSPLALELVGDGVVRGKAALRDYWRLGLAKSPGLRFELIGIFVGHDSLVIHYRNQRGQISAEWLRLDSDGRAVEGAAHRGVAPPQP
jgi:hypothetical protein